MKGPLSWRKRVTGVFSESGARHGRRFAGAGFHSQPEDCFQAGDCPVTRGNQAQDSLAGCIVLYFHAGPAAGAVSH